jgi:hypothetical protein
MREEGLFMKSQLGLLTCLALFPATLAAETPPSATAPVGNAAGGLRPAVVEGQPIETRPPEKKDNSPPSPSRPARRIMRRRPSRSRR